MLPKPQHDSQETHLTNQPSQHVDLSPETRALVDAAVAAVAGASHLCGSGDKYGVDAAAVAAMRASLQASGFDGVVVIGEGEKDEAPMLFTGERFGNSSTPKWDIAVDPIDGTALAATGADGAVAVIAVSEHGTMALAPEVFYMQKLVTSAAGKGVVDLDLSPTQNVEALAAVLGKKVSEVRVAVIDKPRNSELIAELQAAGAQWARFAEGDVAQAVVAASTGTDIDILLGVGGNPEGVASAVAVQVLGGFMQGRLAPQTELERGSALAVGLDLERKFELHELVAGGRHIFVMAGFTDGPLTRGFSAEQSNANAINVEVLVLDNALGGARVLTEAARLV
jgi:fructose-1,6-bisphosphatase II